MNPFLILSTLNLSLGGLVFLFGFLILRENPGQRLNRVVALMLFFGGLGAVFAALTFMATQRGGTPTSLRDLSYVWELFFPTLFLFASLFPEERAFIRRPLLRLGRFRLGLTPLLFVPHAFHVVFVLLAPSWTGGAVDAPRYLGALATLSGLLLRFFLYVHRTLFSLVNLGFGLATIALLFDSYRRARVPRLRRQVGVVAVGLSACLVLYSLASPIPTLLGWRMGDALRASLVFTALMLGPGSIAYAVVLYKFLDARMLARRGILYALVSAALVGGYLAVAPPLSRSLSGVAGGDSRIFESVLLIVALALSQPGVAWLETVLDRSFLRDPADYRNVLRGLGAELQTTIDLDTLLRRTITTLTDAMMLRAGYIVVFGGSAPIACSGACPVPDPAALERVARLLERVPAGEGSFRVADPVPGLEPADRRFLAALGVALVVPLRWHADLVGALLLGEKLTDTTLSAEDVALLDSLAGQVSVSLQNALLLRDRVAVARFEEELSLARQIQSRSLLSSFPRLPRCEVHALTIPSKHVGGDFYDVVPAADGSWLVAIADVSGKGVPAALLSSMLQASLRTQAASVAAPAEILRNINQLMYRSTAIQQFASFFLARLDAERLELVFSNAGHNWPVLQRRDGQRRLLERGGVLLGILEGVGFEEERLTLEPGDLLVLYTDGVSEAANAAGEMFDEERLYEAVAAMPSALSAREVAERLLAILHGFLDGTEPQDDVTLLVVKVPDYGTDAASTESSVAELATARAPSGR